MNIICKLTLPSLFTVTQHDSNKPKSDLTTSVAPKERSRKHSPITAFDTKDISECKTQHSEFCNLEKDTKIENDDLKIFPSYPVNFADFDRLTEHNTYNSKNGVFYANPDQSEYRSNTIRRKVKQKVGKDAKDLISRNSQEDSSLCFQSPISFPKRQKANENVQYQSCHEVNQSSLIAAFHKQSNDRKSTHLQSQVYVMKIA